jgi:Zn-dependent protease
MMEQTPAIPVDPSLELPKPELAEPKSKANIWLKSLISLAFFLVAGYFFFQNNWSLVLVLTAVVIFHELGHFLAMKFYKYQDLGIYFIPLMGAYVSGKKQEVSQTQSAVILLAGPVPGIILGIIFHFVAVTSEIRLFEQAAWILIFLNVLNLLPVYPLDGGQLLHRLFLDEYNILGKIFVILSVALMIWFAVRSEFLPLLFFPFLMLSRMIGDLQHERLVKKIEAEGIDLVKSYDELSAEEYWRLRNVIIKYYPQLKDVKPSPPYEISPKEDQVILIIQGLLHRSLLQDLSLTGKFFILLVWIICFAAPFFIIDPFIFF